MNFTYDTETNEFVKVYDLEDCLKAIRVRNQNNEDRIKRLNEENKKLKEEHYKDNEIQRLQAELETFKKDYYRGFPISEREENKINEWKDKHEAETHGIVSLKDKTRYGGTIGGVYSYYFTPTTIGMIGVIRCNCGAEFTFQDL